MCNFQSFIKTTAVCLSLPVMLCNVPMAVCRHVCVNSFFSGSMCTHLFWCLLGRGLEAFGRKECVFLSVPPVLFFTPVQCDPVPYWGGTSHLTSACLQGEGGEVLRLGCPYWAPSPPHSPNQPDPVLHTCTDPAPHLLLPAPFVHLSVCVCEM